MVRCNDNSLYTGITTDLARRLAEHNGLDTAEQPQRSSSAPATKREPEQNCSEGQLQDVPRSEPASSLNNPSNDVSQRTIRLANSPQEPAATPTQADNSSSPHAKLKRPRKTGKGASYTRSRRPVTLVYSDIAANRSAASRREWEIKQLSRKAKERLLTGVKS